MIVIQSSRASCSSWLDVVHLILVHELFGAADDFIGRPPVLASLEVENVTNLVASSENEINVVLGVRGRKTESNSRRDQGGSTVNTGGA